MRRLAWIVLVALVTACASAQRDRETALLRDAKECEADADAQLQNAGQNDPGIRSCSSRRVWGSADGRASESLTTGA